MKKINKFLLISGILAGTMSFTSCVGDLDLTPVDDNSIINTEFKDNPEAALDRVMADCYLQFATTGVGGANGSPAVNGFDGGCGTFTRAIFNLNEIPTDEASWISASDSYLCASIQYSIFPVDNSTIYGTFERLRINASICANFIQDVEQGNFFIDDIANEADKARVKAKAEEYVRQARILHSLCYFYLIDMFGNVPYIDETMAQGSTPAQLQRAEVYNIVTTNLENVIAEYGDNYSVEYGHVGKEAAEALLVKFYLNAEVFTGTPAYDKCLALAKKIIARHQGTGFEGSGLAESFRGLFAANNDQYAPGGSNPGGVNEILWSIPQDDNYLNSYAGTTVLLAGWITDGTDEFRISKLDYNSNEGWKCMIAPREFVEQFDWHDNYSYSDDARTEGWCTTANGFFLENTGFDSQDRFGHGFICPKYTNFEYDEYGNNIGGPTTKFCNADFSVIRLAEIYLSAAEACLRGAGSNTEALEYVNLIRRRAWLEDWGVADLNLNTLLQERSRELYQENCRRTDLVRFGKFTGSAYLWSGKNGTIPGSAIPEHYNLYPIPQTVIGLTGYTQNPGY